MGSASVRDHQAPFCPHYSHSHVDEDELFMQRRGGRGSVMSKGPQVSAAGPAGTQIPSLGSEAETEY